MADIPIISGVPVPDVNYGSTKRVYPFAKLEVGQLFFVPAATRTLYVSAWRHGAKLDRQFAVRDVTMRKTQRGWRMCAPDVEGAVSGLGVWRVA